MPDMQALNLAVKTLVETYASKLGGFDTREFLRTGVDPFRFTFNVSVWGLNRAIAKEIEHKLEMALENAVGAFHENYLGNSRRKPKNSQWRKVPPGEILGTDIANETEGIYLQVKSKHNSMNSSSAARLAQELSELKVKKPKATIGCAWVIATQSRACTGERDIRRVGQVLKGKQVYDFVTGAEGDMDAVLIALPVVIEQIAQEVDLVQKLEEVTQKVQVELQRLAGTSDKDVIRYICSQSVD